MKSGATDELGDDALVQKKIGLYPIKNPGKMPGLLL